MSAFGGIVCGTLFFVSLSALAQDRPTRQTDIENSRANTSLIIADIRPKLFGNLPPSERLIYDQIQFSVSSDDKIMNAYADRKGGVRRVVLTEAIGRGTELTADAFLMEELYHMPGFLGKYMSFICERYQRNFNRYGQGLTPLRIPSPYEFAHWSDKDMDAFYSDKDISHARNVVVGAAFSFLLAHEVAHHVKDHVDHPTSDLAHRREQETEADAWAIDLLVRKNLNPVDGIIPMLFFYYTDQHPISREAGSDHPADARRLLAMYEGLSKRLPSFKPYLQGVDYDTAKKRVDLSISLVKEEIAAGDSGTNSYPSGSQPPSDSHSLQAAVNSKFCDDLNSYVTAAANNFRSLRGAPDPDSEGQGFGARHGIDGFTDCTVWIYRDRSIEPSSSCDAIEGNVDTIRTSVRACLSTGWTSRARGKDYIFEGSNGITIRVSESSSGKSVLWVDSPSRD
jgi:hypothetical protein